MLASPYFSLAKHVLEHTSRHAPLFDSDKPPIANLKMNYSNHQTHNLRIPMRALVLSLTLLLFSAALEAQNDSTGFSREPIAFWSELEALLIRTGNPRLEQLAKDFGKLWLAGYYQPAEAERIARTASGMYLKGMGPTPYFRTYLEALMHIKNAEQAGSRIQEWHDLLDTLLTQVSARRFKPFQNFLEFSRDFFQEGALRRAGVTWKTTSSRWEMRIDTSGPVIYIPETDLIALQGRDSTRIVGTGGIYHTTTRTWYGQGGRVDWSRYGLAPDELFVELGEYRVDVTKALYEAKHVQLRYPRFFGQRPVEGYFRDKVTRIRKDKRGLYPSFESYAHDLQVDNFGEGVHFRGGMRLEGLTIYGTGTDEQPAVVTIFNYDGVRRFRGAARLFVIREQERLTGEQVEVAIYFGADSIYHPSVNVRYDMNRRLLNLRRGKRGSDRNPFTDSYHALRIDVEHLDADFDVDSLFVGPKKMALAQAPRPAYFESVHYFDPMAYRRIQRIADFNPLGLIQSVHRQTGQRVIPAGALAQHLNPNYTVDNIRTLLFELAAKGFVRYDTDKELVYLQDKIFHFASADKGEVDHDWLRLESDTRLPNGLMSLCDGRLLANGIAHVEFSKRQRVGLKPFDERITFLENRDMDFNGRLFAGFAVLTGKDMHFRYDPFLIEMDSVRYLDLFLPTGRVDRDGKPEALSIASRIEHVGGTLLIDAPHNKSGRADIPSFPSLHTDRPAYVFYDWPDLFEGAYARDSFYFRLDPFHLNELDELRPGDLAFGGTMVSALIFPDFHETLVLQKDRSLGFVTRTPDEGFPAYTGKGVYTGQISLSNQGFLGKGTLSYLSAQIDSDDFVFKPGQTLASAERFNMEEDRSGPVEVPQVRGYDVQIDWRPWLDSMYVRSEEAPFELYRTGTHFLKGTLILTPGGLKGRGLFDWGKASMRSNLFSFGAFSTKADTTDLRIRAFDADAIALQTSNLNGQVDFDAQLGQFRANAQFLTTTLPYNQYTTSFNEFDWDMAGQTVTFKATQGRLGRFVSIHPEQDSLHFQGKAARYDLRSNLLEVEGVPWIVASDAFIYPDSGKVVVQPGGRMRTLRNARIVADTSSKYHVINRAEVQVLGRKEYRAKGYYEYNVPGREQEIWFERIVGTRVGKGPRSQKASVTRATTQIAPEAGFFMGDHVEYFGTIVLSAEKPLLKFNGFARLQSETLPSRHWFSIDCEADRNELILPFDTPKNYEGQPLATGFFLSKETGNPYARIMMPLYFRRDRPLLPVKGVIRYEPRLRRFVMGDSARVLGSALTGNMLVYYDKNGQVEGSGRIGLGSGLEFVSVEAAGTIETTFSGEVIDSALGITAGQEVIRAEVMAGIRLPLPDNLMRLLLLDFQSEVFGTDFVVYASDIAFYQRAVANLFPHQDKDIQRVIADLAGGTLHLPKKLNDYTLLFSKIPLKWDPDYRSFISLEDKLGLVSVGGEMFNRKVKAYVEFKMPANGKDRLYVYLESPAGYYYFFGFRDGVLNIVSNNTRFNDEVIGMKEKERLIKMDDGQVYEIAPVNPGTAHAFVRRVLAGRSGR